MPVIPRLGRAGLSLAGLRIATPRNKGLLGPLIEEEVVKIGR
jgi:hypothetical protein